MAIKATTGKGMILPLSCAAQFKVVLDIAIVNVALPSIQKDLGIGQSTLQWIVIVYGLMLGGFLLLGGRMADLLGRRRVLLTGLVLFSSASLLAGLAGSAGLLIGARAPHERWAELAKSHASAHHNAPTAVFTCLHG